MDNIDLLDFEIIEDSCIVFTKPNELFEIKKYFEDQSVKVKDEEIIMDPITMVDIDSSQEEKILDLSNKIDTWKKVMKAFHLEIGTPLGYRSIKKHC